MIYLNRDKEAKALKETDGLKSRKKNRLWRIYKYNDKTSTKDRWQTQQLLKRIFSGKLPTRREYLGIVRNRLGGASKVPCFNEGNHRHLLLKTTKCHPHRRRAGGRRRGAAERDDDQLAHLRRQPRAWV